MAQVDWGKIDAMTDEDIIRQSREDGTDGETISGVFPTSTTVQRSFGMTQKAIAEGYRLPRNRDASRLILPSEQS